MHSGDSACAIPPPTLTRRDDRDASRRTRARLADALDVRGLLNVQYAVKDGERATSSRRTRAPAARCRSSARRPACRWPRSRPGSWSARRSPSCATEGLAAPAGRRRPRRGEGGGAAVQPLPRRRHHARPRDALTGEVMGIDRSFGLAFAKSQAAAGNRLPEHGHGVPLARRPRQAARARRGAPLRRARLRARRDRRHRGRARGRGPPGRGGRGEGRRGARAMRRGRPHLVGQGRPGGQHAPGPGPAGRRRPHPPGRDRPPGPVPHHRGGGARRGGRDRRVGAEPRPTVRSLQEYHRDGQLRLEV